MKRLRFKFHQNQPINEEFDFWRGKILTGDPEGSRETRYKKFLRASYRTVVSSYTENFNILAQLESVQKTGELNRLLWG